MLDYQDYKQFYRNFSELRREFGYGWKCDNNWEDLVNEALCMVDNTYPECKPERFVAFEETWQALRDAGLYALYDERHIDTTQYVDQFCENTKMENPLYDPSCTEECEDEFITDPTCDYLRSERDRYLN